MNVKSSLDLFPSNVRKGRYGKARRMDGCVRPPDHGSLSEPELKRASSWGIEELGPDIFNPRRLPMNAFIQKYRSVVKGVLSGFDRLVFRGTLMPLCSPGGC